MFRSTFLVVLAVALPAAHSQLISFKDGKIGVNFAGYHAEAGLGGLLTGNAAHGGLSASAGTPFGQRAGAGLGGTVDEGQTKGGLYAGASAGYGVGASAALGGNVDETGAAGGSGAEAHARGLSTKTVKLSQTPQRTLLVKEKDFSKSVVPLSSVDQRSSIPSSDIPAQPSVEQQLPVVSNGRRFHKRKHVRRLNRNRGVQFERRFNAPESQEKSFASNTNNNNPQADFDYRKFLDFGFFSNAGATLAGAPHPSTLNGQVFNYQKQISPGTVVLHKTVVPYNQEVGINQRIGEDEGYDNYEQTKTKPNAVSSGGATTYTATKRFQPNPNFFNDIFNIPISTLGAVSQFLSNGANNGYTVSKTKSVQQY